MTIRHSARTPAVRRTRPGMTLMEVIVALTLLGGALFALAGFSSRLALAASSAQVEAVADELTSDRLEAAKSKRTYVGIDSLVATENPPPGPRSVGFVRKTLVRRVGGLATDSTDYKIVTVEVSHAKLPKPQSKTIVIAAY
jgi:prepilin-type N-terminal cleavage/methylation domain-containing protein